MTERTATRERQRINATENLFRQVNERVKDLNERFGKDQGESILVICECGRESCIEQIEMTVAEYENIRSHPDVFAIKPDHAIRRYWTVSKNR
jgi:hypothetical protein